MSRTPEEIYEDIAALTDERIAIGDGTDTAEKLANAQARLDIYRQQQKLWDELADALVSGKPQPPWILAAVHGAISYTVELQIRADERIDRLRQVLATSPQD